MLGNKIIVLLSTKKSKLFLCSADTFSQLHSCGDDPVVHFQYEDLVLFEKETLSRDFSPSTYPYTCCLSQTCRTCKGYGIIKPTEAYHRLVGTGIIRGDRHVNADIVVEFMKQWIPRYVDLESQPPCSSCVWNKICLLKSLRKQCIPFSENDLTEPSVTVPAVVPVDRRCVFPTLFWNDDFVVLCVNTTMKYIRNVAFRDTFTRRDLFPFFMFAEIQKPIPTLEVPRAVADLVNIHFIAKQFCLNVKMVPFVPSTDFHKQTAFGRGFITVRDYSSYLLRFAPLRRYRPHLERLDPFTKISLVILPDASYYSHPLLWPKFSEDNIIGSLKIALGRIFGLI